MPDKDTLIDLSVLAASIGQNVCSCAGSLSEISGANSGRIKFC